MSRYQKLTDDTLPRKPSKLFTKRSLSSGSPNISIHPILIAPKDRLLVPEPLEEVYECDDDDVMVVSVQNNLTSWVRQKTNPTDSGFHSSTTTPPKSPQLPDRLLTVTQFLASTSSACSAISRQTETEDLSLLQQTFLVNGERTGTPHLKNLIVEESEKPRFSWSSKPIRRHSISTPTPRPPRPSLTRIFSAFNFTKKEPSISTSSPIHVDPMVNSRRKLHGPRPSPVLAQRRPRSLAGVAVATEKSGDEETPTVVYSVSGDLPCWERGV
ncbi:hypothetical protein BC829DRAFT_400125 [Chytridium lagenaria]|nr:hypothetical protein BC829DRAFT_400125 [Chytridium lagenaria]